MKPASNQDKEIADLRAQLAEQTAHMMSVFESKDSRIEQLDSMVDQLKEALILERHRQFAKANEALRSLQRELFNEAEQEALGLDKQGLADEDTVTVPTHQRKRGGRKPLPKDLPRIDVVYDLNDDDKVCPQGHDMTCIGEKTSEQLDVIPMKIQVIRHARKQYACPCCEGELRTASKPKQPIEKSQASAGLLAYIAVSKYADSLPLYRQSQMFKRFEVDLNRTTLANWMVRCGELVQPLINRLEEQLLTAPIVHMDETPVQVLNEKRKAAQSKSYMWVRSASPPGGVANNDQIRLFDYDPSRSGNVPARLLAGYKGALMVDGYEAYQSVCQAQGLIRLGCWAHARRKFVDAAKANKKNNGQANKVIKLMAKLYALEKRLSDVDTQTRYQERQAHAKPITDELRIWLEQTQPKVPPQSLLGKAMHYLEKQWLRLVGYLDDGGYPIDNNAVENAIRPFAIGRKNWLFSTSVEGAKASANLYSLIETAKANGVEPYTYLKRVFAELPNASGFDDVDQLLPGNCKQN